MAVSEQDIKEEETIAEDFEKAEEIYRRIRKKFESSMVADENMLFALCLIYSKMKRKTA